MKVRAKFTGVALLTVVATLLNAAAAMGDDAEKGKLLYAGRCAFCHGLAGKGDGPAGSALKPPPTNFTSTEYWTTAQLDTIKATIANGKPNTAMVAFKSSLSTADIDDIIVYLRTFKP